MKTSELRPGSLEAISAGCSCPVMDNAYGHGRGVDSETQKPIFVYSELCPIHGAEALKTQKG
jgi:hypothetical protein